MDLASITVTCAAPSVSSRIWTPSASPHGQSKHRTGWHKAIHPSSQVQPFMSAKCFNMHLFGSQSCPPLWRLLGLNYRCISWVFQVLKTHYRETKYISGEQGGNRPLFWCMISLGEKNTKKLLKKLASNWENKRSKDLHVFPFGKRGNKLFFIGFKYIKHQTISTITKSVPVRFIHDKLLCNSPVIPLAALILCYVSDVLWKHIVPGPKMCQMLFVPLISQT